MKKIQYANDYHRIKSLIDESKSSAHEICLWQKDNETEKRNIHNVQIERNLFDEKKIWLKSTHLSSLKFITQTTTFYYCHELNIIFKTILISNENENVCISYPEEVTFLDEEDAQKEEFAWMKSMHLGEEFSWVKGKKVEAEDDTMRVKGSKEETNNDIIRVTSQLPNEKEAEEKFKTLRESARLTPKDDKHVTLIRDSIPEVQTEYKLFDLSQGGAGLLIFSPTQFKIGEAVSIVAIDKKPIDKILTGSVVAIRPYDEGKGEWKLGIKFS